ncbi:unnamed protein product, partial [Mesorhabditis belari]|uniref:Uncharacterized protein n=1 Tax=Mesorhabditis belari TaxID=2138241 RepID=A0AAF3EMX4_9BILA
MRQLKHLALYAYKSPAQRFEPLPEQQTKRQNNKARPTRVDGYHGGTSRKAPDQKFEQRDKKELRPQHPPPSDSPQLSQNSHAGSLYGSTTNPSNDDMTSQFPHASPVSMETDDMELEASTLAEQRNAVDSPNGHQDANLIREAQLNAHNINARLQDLSPEQAKLFLNTLSKNLWREDKQRLLDHAARARPHNTSDTLSINETRTWIYQLIDPILKACTMIQRNLQQLDWQ